MDITNDLFASEQVINNIPYNSTNPALLVILNIEIILSNKGTDSVLTEKDQVPNVIAESNIKTINTKYDSDKYCCLSLFFLLNKLPINIATTLINANLKVSHFGSKR